VRVWEHYEINVTIQRKISFMGLWNLPAGFQQMDTQKWIRRRNLEARKLVTFFISLFPTLKLKIYYI
jgi:hypothetical protein